MFRENERKPWNGSNFDHEFDMTFSTLIFTLWNPGAEIAHLLWFWREEKKYAKYLHFLTHNAIFVQQSNDLQE